MSVEMKLEFICFASFVCFDCLGVRKNFKMICHTYRCIIPSMKHKSRCFFLLDFYPNLFSGTRWAESWSKIWMIKQSRAAHAHCFICFYVFVRTQNNCLYVEGEVEHLRQLWKHRCVGLVRRSERCRLCRWETLCANVMFIFLKPLFFSLHLWRDDRIVWLFLHIF